MLPYCSLFSVGQYWSHFLWENKTDTVNDTRDHVSNIIFSVRNFPLYFCRWWKRTYPAFFHQVGNHDDDLSVLLPNHPPKVLECWLERTLSSYISSGPVVALKQESSEISTGKMWSILNRLHTTPEMAWYKWLTYKSYWLVLKPSPSAHRKWSYLFLNIF